MNQPITPLKAQAMSHKELALHHQLERLTEEERQILEDEMFIRFEADYGTEANQRLLDDKLAIEKMVALYSI